MTLLLFLTLSALVGLAVGCAYGFAESALSALGGSPSSRGSDSVVVRLWSHVRLGFMGKALFAVVFLLVCSALFAVALAAPVFLFAAFSLHEPALAVLAYLVLFGCMWLGVLAGRRLSTRRGHHAA